MRNRDFSSDHWYGHQHMDCHMYEMQKSMFCSRIHADCTQHIHTQNQKQWNTTNNQTKIQPNLFIYYVYVQIMFTFIHSFMTLFHSLWTIPTITNYNETELKLAKLRQYLKESERIRLFAYFWRCTNDMNSNEDSKNVHVQTIGPWVGGVVDCK